jgi:hypothetical protein
MRAFFILENKLNRTFKEKSKTTFNVDAYYLAS